MGSDMEPVPYTPLRVGHTMPRMRSRGYVMVVPNRVVTVTIPMAGVS